MIIQHRLVSVSQQWRRRSIRSTQPFWAATKNKGESCKVATLLANSNSSMSKSQTLAAARRKQVIDTVSKERTYQTGSNILPLSIVDNPRLKNDILPIVGNAAYVAIASGFLMTDMLDLRLLLVGGYSGLVAFHMLHLKPLRIPLRWSAVFVLVNAGAAALLIADRFGVTLAEDDEELYREHFSGHLTRGQFSQLLALGTREEVPDEQVLTIEGTRCKYLYFIIEGKARNYHHQEMVSIIRQGGFVNDIAFQRGDDVGAYGTVVSSGKMSIIKWDQSELREHMKRRSDMERNMKHCLSDHLVRTLLNQREAAHARQRKEKDFGANLRRSVTLKRSPSESHITFIDVDDEKTPATDNTNKTNNNSTENAVILKRSPSQNNISFIVGEDEKKEKNSTDNANSASAAEPITPVSTTTANNNMSEDGKIKLFM